MEETTTTTTTNTETIIQFKGDLGDEDKSGKPVTTVSTICVKCGDLIRLALSLLRRYDKNVLCVDEMKPSFVDVGTNLTEANQLNDLHKELQSKLASKQTNIEEMLTKADQMVEKQPENQAVVYEAMAESLGATWKELNSQLQLRGNLLEDAVNFFNYVKKNQDQLQKLETFLRALQNLGDVNAVKDAADKHKEIKNDVLDTAVGAMTYGEKSIEKIREIGSKSDDLERVKEVYNACTKIEKVMINLDEKRKELDQVWHEKKQTLDFKKQATQIYNDLQSIEEWVRKRLEDLRRQDLGDSEISADNLRAENEKILNECKDMLTVADRLIASNEELLQAGYNDGGDLKSRCLKVKNQMHDLVGMLENRRQLLQMALHFFRSADSALNKLDALNSEARSLSLGRERQAIMKQHEELNRRVQEAARSALDQGRLLLDKAGRHPGSRGVENKCNELERRQEEMLSVCSISKAEAMIRDQAFHEVMDKFGALNNWLTNVGESNLFTMNDMGTNLPTAGDFLERHKILANDVGTRSLDFKNFLATADRPDIRPGDPQYEEIYVKTKDLKNRWEKFERLLANRIKLGEIYYEFHKKAAKLTSDMDSLDSLVKNLRDLDPYSQNQFENRWSSLNNDFQDLKRAADDFASQSRKSADDGRLNIRGAQRCVDAILDDLGGRRLVIGRSWADVQTKMKKDQEMKQYWDNFVAECGKNDLNGADTKLCMNFNGSQLIKALLFTNESTLHESDTIGQSRDLNREISLIYRNFEERPPSNVAFRQENCLVNLRCQIQRTEQQLESLINNAKSFVDVPLDRQAEKSKLLDDLSRTYRDVQQMAAQFEVLTGMTVTFFRNLQKIDDWIDRVGDRFSAENLQKYEREGRIDQIAQEHKSAGQSIDEFIRFAKSETEQILNRSRQPEIPETARRECEKLPGLVEERVVKWTSMYQTQTLTIQQFSTVSKFEKEIVEVIETVETMFKTLRNIDESSKLSQQAYQAAQHDLFVLEQKVQPTDQKVSQIIRTAEHHLSGPQAGNRIIREYTDQLRLKWDDFRRRMDDTKRNLEAAKSYWSLIDQSETWIKETSEFVVDAGRKTNELKTSRDADSLKSKMDEFMSKKKVEQEERIEKIEKSARVLYGEEAEHKIERQKRRYKEIVDSFHVIDARLQSIKQTLLASEEASFKEIKETKLAAPPQAPRFVQPLSDGQVTEGSRFEFICQVEGQPMPNVTWFKDGIAISSNPDYQTSFRNGVCTLKIEETMTEDSSVYTCKAYNDIGTAETTAHLSVKESPFLHMKAPEFIRKLQSSTVNESESFVFECTVIGNPAPVVSWYKDDQCVDRAPEYRTSTDQSGNCRLRIDRASRSDHATFKCRAVNPAGEASTSANLNVTIPHQPPKVTQPLRSASIMEGNRIMFEVRVSGDPEPDVTWYKDGIALSSSPTCQILKDHYGCHRLVMENVNLQDSGEYSIKATNLAGEARSSANLQVNAKPAPKIQKQQFVTEEFFECYTDLNGVTHPGPPPIPPKPVEMITKSHFDERELIDSRRTTVERDANMVPPHFSKTVVSVVAEEGQTVMFDGFVTGTPTPAISWSKDGKELHPRDYRQSFTDGSVSLTIPKVSPSDAGKYICSAKNAAGLATSSAQLVVTVNKEAPDFVDRLISQEVEESTPLRWQVKVSGDPTPKVTWHKNDVLVQHCPEIQTVNLGNNVHVLYIPQCRLADAGQFTCKAENEAGEARSTADLVVRRHGEQPKSYYHVTKVFQHEQGKDTLSNRTKVGPLPFKANFNNGVKS